jgi:hypothetical protein
MDDGQLLFNIIVGVAGMFGGWILNNISRSIERLDKDVRQMPLTYVTRADYRADIDEVKANPWPYLGQAGRQGRQVTTVELIIKAWPIFLGLITLIVILAKMDVRLAVVEEKVKQLFSLWNQRDK